VFGEDERDRGERRGPGDDQLDPSVEKRRERTKALANVDVRAAGPREGGHERDERKRPSERDRGARDPDERDAADRPKLTRDAARHAKDPAADRNADEQGRRAHDAELARELLRSAPRTRTFVHLTGLGREAT